MMFAGYHRIFWGLLIATFNIKFGMVKIFPAFVGFMVIYSGINLLYEEAQSMEFKEAKIWALITIIASIGGTIMDFIGHDNLYWSLSFSIWTGIYFVIELLMVFKLLEASIMYLDSKNYLDTAKEYGEIQRNFTVLYIINLVLIHISTIYNIKLLGGISAFIAFGLRLYLIFIINNLKKLFVPILED